MKIENRNIVTLTEVESILFNVGMGLSDGSEFETSAWKKRQAFKKDDGTHKRHIAHLKCCADEVIIEGKGRNRTYTLVNVYDAPVPRLTGNVTNGDKSTKIQDEIMKEHLFAKLCSRFNMNFEESKFFTVNQLMDLADLLPVSDKVSSSVWKEMKEIFKGHYSDELTMHIKRNASRNINDRKRADVKLHIKHLEKEGRIYVYDSYNVKYLVDSIQMIKEQEYLDETYGLGKERVSLFQKVDEEKFTEVRDNIKEIVLTEGFSYAEYIQAIMKLIKIDDDMRELLNKVEVYLESEGLDFIFLSMEIMILKPETVIQITHEEAEKAFTDKLIFRTNARMNRGAYTNRTDYIKEFYRLAMFVTLRQLDVKGLDEVIADEIAIIAEKVNGMYSIYCTKQIEKIVWGFGTEAVTKEKTSNPILSNEFISTLFNPVEATSKETKEKVEDMKVVPFKKKMTKSAQEDLEWLRKFSKKKVVTTQLDEQRKVRVVANNRNPKEIDIAAIFEDEPLEKVEFKNNIFNPFDDRDNSLPFDTPAREVETVVEEDEGWIFDEDEVISIDLVRFHEVLHNKRRINMSEIIANQPPVKGFGWGIEQRQKELASQ